MAKDKEKAVAKKLFIEQLMSRKDIAEYIGITEKTVGKWVQVENWEQIRDAKLNNSKSRSENIKKVIDELTNMTLQIIEKIKHAEKHGDTDTLLNLKKETTRLSQEVAMYNKALEKLEAEYKISLSTYLDVMEDIFQSLNRHNHQLWMQTLDFQKQHLQSVANKIG
ncbi:MAG: phage terminase small subunit-related protein [Chitinophagales bacterium]|nr:phage terminase small subunit-related protein [Chitinophagales bacterium]